MSEVNRPENQNSQNQENIQPRIEAYLDERAQWMADAVELVAGDRTANPFEVFPEPGEVRAEGQGLNLTQEQEAQLREVAGRFGIGGESDVVNAARAQILEGGKPWKLEAEARIAGQAQTVLFAGSPYRKLGQDETEYLGQKFGEVAGETEYDMVRQIATAQEGFQPLEEPEVLSFGYDIHNNHALVTEPTGQLIKIGTIDNRDVMVLRVDRENYTDDEGKQKYRNQPDGAALLRFVSDVLSASGDEDSSVGINSSTTYASRAVDTVRAGLRSGRMFEIGMYGRQTLADVRDLPVAEPTAINQIPGELHEMWVKLQQLRTEIDSAS